MILPKPLKDIVYKVLEVITSSLSNVNAHQVSRFYAVRKKSKYKEFLLKHRHRPVTGELPGVLRCNVVMQCMVNKFSKTRKSLTLL